MTNSAFSVVAAGQSNMGGWFKSTIAGHNQPLLTTTQAVAFTSSSSGGAWGSVTGLGAATFAGYLAEAMPGTTIKFVNGAIGGSGLVPLAGNAKSVWSDRGVGSPFAATTSLIERSGVEPDALIWSQGENDAAARVSAVQHGAALAQLFSDARGSWGVDTVAVAGLGLNLSHGDPIRAAQQWAVAQTPAASYHATDVRLELTDSVHFTGASYAWQAVDVARGILATRGIADPGAPDIVASGAGGSLSGTDRGERLLGSETSDVIVAGAGDDIVRGRGGNDTISGGAGNDILSGGTGDDVLSGGAGNDHLFGDAGNDTIIAGPGFDVVDGGAGLDTIRFEGLSADFVFGRTAVNVYRLTSLDGTVSTTFGNTVEFLSFDDITIDVRIAGPSSSFVGTAGNDTLTGFATNDTIFGYSGNDRLNGLLGNDVLHGGDGNDTLDGGVGSDMMRGGAGNDFYIVDNVGDVVDETDPSSGLDSGGTDTVNSSVSFALGAGVENLGLSGSAAIDGSGNALANRLTGNAAANRLDGGEGNDTLNGNVGDDVLIGGNGSDNLSGGEGNDILRGGSGSDTLTGGNGADRFVFDSAGTGRDLISDFQQGSDRIVLDSGVFSGLAPGAQVTLVVNGALAAGQAGLTFNSATRVLSFDADGAGGAGPVEVAIFSRPVVLLPSDIQII